MRDLGEQEAERRRADLAASYQRAIVESLAIRVERALAETGLERLSVGGGVAANGPVRERMRSLGVELHVPPRELCTDNAAMIASAARFAGALPYPGLPRSRRLRDRRADADRAMTTVVLYGRAGCCLCDDAREILERVRRERPFALEERDIDSDDALLRAYLERIPVVTIDGCGGVRAVRERVRARAPARYGAQRMSYTVGTDPETAQPGLDKPGEKLALGVAARLSRYLQVLIQARKMGKETISSQELADYTHVNSTQIRRDLSGFGKFGKRGVGYNVESLVDADPQDPADLGPAQHRAVRRRPPGHRDRDLGHLRRPRLPRRRDLRCRRGQGGDEDRDARGSPQLRSARS